MKYLLTAKACLAAACALLPAASAAEDWKVSSSVNYDTGKYGTSDRTDSVYIPFTLKRYYGYADLSVTVPWLRQSSTGRVTRVGGRPARAAGKTQAPAGSCESGPGDILVRGGYVVKEEGPRSFDLSLAGLLKLPTANEHKGLGTGELDEGLGLELAKKISPRFTLLADGYYTIIGDPAGIDYSNQLSFDIGFSRPVAADLTLTVLYETRSALLDGNSDPRDLSFSLDYKAADGNRYSGGLLLGLSDGSPDAGLSAGVSRRF
ncbi:MAG: hypothetical protein A2X35_00100 [Elusimicrobia bacterium GWA2_61_42]|nr:MAG: hypothetical protein A2X35_00100 [Elusimicrobia bacterium GWA2_61_42]OGR78095.1 MAG: hypothetical protein A2X38_06805 [Elusimicrobia bacterium GWC2_61_25]